MKMKVTNKYRVEGSICNRYLIEEAAKFASYYFQNGDATFFRTLHRNEVPESNIEDDIDRLSVFKRHGQPLGKAGLRMLTDPEYKASITYVLLNCPEVQPYTA